MKHPVHQIIPFTVTYHINVVCLGHVTKIELELKEAPDDAILVGSMPSELDMTAEINSTYPHGELKT